MIPLAQRAKWYVYELIDGRDQAVFYVGKGMSNRMYAHEAQARAGVCSRKTFRIRDIWAAGARIIYRQIAFFWEEQAAYDHETDVIEHYGLANLTNVIPGGQKAFERRCKELAERKKPTQTDMQFVKSMAPYMAWWLVYSEGGTHSLEHTFHGMPEKEAADRKWYNEYLDNKLFPQVWNKVIQVSENLEKLYEIFIRFSVRLVWQHESAS